MMKILAVVATIVLAITSVALAAGYRNVDSGEVVKLLKNKDTVLIDVRTPEEYRKAHIRGAQLIPVSDLGQRIGEIPRQRPIVVYCTVGSRSRVAAEMLASKKLPEVYNMSDGIIGWHRNGFPIEK